MTQKILRLPAVKDKTGCSRSTIYALISEGKFPKSIALTQRSVGWLEADINSWIDGRVVASHKFREGKICN